MINLHIKHSQHLSVVSRLWRNFRGKNRDLVEHLEDGGKSLGLHGSKVKYYLPNDQRKQFTKDRQSNYNIMFFPNIEIKK